MGGWLTYTRESKAEQRDFDEYHTRRGVGVRRGRRAN